MNKRQQILKFNELHERYIAASKKFILSFVVSVAFLLAALHLQNLKTVFYFFAAIGICGVAIACPYLGYRAFAAFYKQYRLRKKL